jgi:putative spermidine/putrescine transport system substrate-binding protein
MEIEAMRTGMKSRIGQLVLAFLLLSACSGPAAQGSGQATSVQLVDWGFTGDTQKVFHDSLAKPFEDAHPGVTIKLLGGVTDDAIAQIKAAQGAAPYDTILLGEPRYLQATQEGWIQPLTAADTPGVADVYPNLQKKCAPNAVAWTVETIGVIYNPDLVPAPASWSDLWKPEYKGKIGMASPASNSTFLFLILLNKLFGKGEADWDAAFQKLDALKPFKVAANPEALGQLLERKEIGLAINWSTDSAITISKGFNAKFTYPAPGPAAQVSCYAVLKNSAHADLAKAYVNQALGVEFQSAFSKAPYYFAPVNKNVQPPAEAAAFIPAPSDYDKLITVDDWSAVLADRETVTDRFTKSYGE